ncbi:MAG: hypothetical protein CFE45_29940, partial [Burkholderiales bacterium PBB5]
GRARKLLEAFRNGRWRVRLSGAANVPHHPPPPLSEDLAVSAPKPGTVRPAFSFAFQPIVDVAAGKAVGYEALIRGIQREPAAAVLNRVPLADVADFDDDARRVAVALAARLGLKSRLHLNVMPQAPGSALASLDSTLETAQRCGLGPQKLVLELKHEASIADPSATALWLQRYREQGVQVSIDDFGSGHAGLALLDHYQPDTISLSMWLVRDIESHGPRQAILRGVMQTGGDLGIEIIAKGGATSCAQRASRSSRVSCWPSLRSKNCHAPCCPPPSTEPSRRRSLCPNPTHSPSSPSSTPGTVASIPSRLWCAGRMAKVPIG